MATPPRPGSQELPPPGGFKPFSVASAVPKAKVRGVHLFGGTAAVCLFGFYLVGQGNIERRKWKAEKRARRAAILPFLQAEEDARYIREQAKKHELEARVMKDVEGWVPGRNVYLTKDFMPPANQRVG